MKLVHLSDLHLGKRVYGFSMLEDQEYILKQILSVIRNEEADGVMIAGDIYDRPVPPAEAVQIFDGFLTRLAEMGISVFAVSGNHDSAERIAFGSELMSSRNVYLSPVYDGRVRSVTMKDAHGEVRIHLLPFLKPAAVRHGLEELCGTAGQEAYYDDTFLNQDGQEASKNQDEQTACEASEKQPVKGIRDESGRLCEDPGSRIETYQDAIQAAVQHMKIDPKERNVLIAHQFVAGAARCESEEVQVGGLDQIDASVFDDFDYVALGHLHSPQQVMRETVRYCGTPLKYSFSEIGQEKSVTVVELGEKGKVSIRKIPLVPLRDMRKIRGTYLEVTALSFYQGTNTEDYIQMILTDEEEIPAGLQKLRLIYPNLMHLEYDNRRTQKNQEIGAADPLEQKSELELFEEFYELQNNQPMSSQQRIYAERLIREILEKN